MIAESFQVTKIHPSPLLPGSDSSAAGSQQGAFGAHPGVSIASSGAGVEDGWEWQCFANHATSPLTSRDEISGQFRNVIRYVVKSLLTTHKKVLLNLLFFYISLNFFITLMVCQIAIVHVLWAF